MANNAAPAFKVGAVNAWSKVANKFSMPLPLNFIEGVYLRGLLKNKTRDPITKTISPLVAYELILKVFYSPTSKVPPF